LAEEEFGEDDQALGLSGEEEIAEDEVVEDDGAEDEVAEEEIFEEDEDAPRKTSAILSIILDLAKFAFI
jgi:hypothetical protein